MRCSFLIIILFLLTILLQQHAVAQCSSQVFTFPYHEDFESTDGNWIPSGTLSDWAWGTPSKPVITGAASGQKCWIAGGLTGSHYNDGESSFIQSPCFDFSN